LLWHKSGTFSFRKGWRTSTSLTLLPAKSQTWKISQTIIQWETDKSMQVTLFKP
jgi:hypothetical protein